MICYRDKTFCSGGTPRCASFATCSKALTEQVWAKAKAAAMPISQYIAPTAMPCYRSPDKPAVKNPKLARVQSHISTMTDAEWRREFEQMPRRPDSIIAEHLRCSSTSIRNARVRLGYPPATGSGINRHTKYTAADALRLVQRDQERIRSLYAAGIKRTTIARDYGHHHRTIRLVLGL